MRGKLRKDIPGFAVLCLLAGTWTSPTTAQLLGPEFRVNTSTSEEQWYPAVAPTGAGEFVIVWNSYSGILNTEPKRIDGQRWSSAGLPQENEFQVSTQTVSWRQRPAIAAQGSGGSVAVWAGPDGYDSGILAQRFDAAGSRVGDEFQVNTYTTGPQLMPAVAADSAGNFLVVWTEYTHFDGDWYGVYAQRFNANGERAGSEFRVNSFTTGKQSEPAVAEDGAGNYLVVWSSQSQDGPGVGVYGQRLDSAGVAVGGEFRVNTQTTGLQWHPAITADSAGNFVVVWEGTGQDGSGSGVFGQRYDPSANPLGGEFQVNDVTLVEQRLPAVAAQSAGDFIVTWESETRDGSFSGVAGKYYDSAGDAVGWEFQVNTSTTFLQQAPAIAALGSGNYVVTWMSNLQDSSGYDVYAQRVTTTTWLFMSGFESGDTSGWTEGTD